MVAGRLSQSAVEDHDGQADAGGEEHQVGRRPEIRCAPREVLTVQPCDHPEIDRRDQLLGEHGCHDGGPPAQTDRTVPSQELAGDEDGDGRWRRQQKSAL